VIAGTAHPVNLTDLRPGVATATVLALGTPGRTRCRADGAVAALAAEELGERTMIGDAGAHALGAAVGLAIVAGNGRGGLAAHAAGVLAAAVYGDRISGLARRCRIGDVLSGR
jgi:hypothetical protein